MLHSVYYSGFVVLISITVNHGPWQSIVVNEAYLRTMTCLALTQIPLSCIFCRNHHPMLVAQWQEGVTRSDLAKVFSFQEFIKVCLIHLL